MLIELLPECPDGHVVVDDDTYECDRCGADQCPCCGNWFLDYDAFLAHLDPN